MKYGHIQLEVAAFVLKMVLLGGSIHMSIKHSDYADYIIAEERREIIQMGKVLSLHGIIARSRLLCHNRFTIDSMNKRLQPTSQLSNEHYHKFVQEKIQELKSLSYMLVMIIWEVKQQ